VKISNPIPSENSTEIGYIKQPVFKSVRVAPIGGWGVAIDQNDHLYIGDRGSYITVYNSTLNFTRNIECNGANGIVLNSTGHIFATAGSQVKIFTNGGDLIQTIGSDGSEPGQFNFPHGIALNSSGYIYVADWGNHRIQVFSPNGEFVQIISHYGTESTQLVNPVGVAFNSSGYLFVSENGKAGIHVYNPFGEYLWTIGVSGTGANGGSASNIGIDSQDNLFVCDYGGSQVRIFNCNGSYIGKIMSSDSFDNSLNPHTITFNSVGHIFISEYFSNRIQEFEIIKYLDIPRYQAIQITPISGWPWGIAVGINKTVYVPNRYGYIDVFNSDMSLVKQITCNGANGITTNSTGHLFVTASNQIKIFTPNGILIKTIGDGSSGSEPGQMNFPHGIALNSTGYIYVAEYSNHRVQIFSPEGDFVGFIGSEGSEIGQLYHPVGVVLNSSNYLFVSEEGNGRVQIFSPTGEFFGFLGNTGGETNFGSPCNIDVDSKDNIYVCAGSIKIFNRNGTYLTQITSSDGLDSNLSAATITAKSDGRIYVSEQSRVQVFQLAGYDYEEGMYYEPPDVEENDTQSYFEPDFFEGGIPRFEPVQTLPVSDWGWGIAVNTNNKVYLANRGGYITKYNRTMDFELQFECSGANGITINSSNYLFVTAGDQIKIYSPNGMNLIKTIGSSGSEAGQLGFPHGIALNSSGYIFVAEYSNHRVQVFSPEGDFVSIIGTQGSDLGQFNNPVGVAFNSSDYLFVSEGGNGRVQIFSPTGEFVKVIGNSGGAAGLATPSNIFIDSHNYLYICDHGSGSIKIYDSNGVYLTEISATNSLDNNFNPATVAINPQGRIYVSEQSRVQVFQIVGYLNITQYEAVQIKPVSGFGWGLAINSNNKVYLANRNGYITKYSRTMEFENQIQCNSANGITINSSNYLFVTAGDQIKIFNPNGILIKTFGTSGSNPGQMNFPHGIALNITGYIYVADWGNHRIQVFSPNGDFIKIISHYGLESSPLSYPVGVAINSSDFLFVSQLGVAQIEVFSPTGVHVRTIGNSGGEASIGGASNIAIDGKDNLYICDMGQHVRIFNPAGIYLKRISSDLSLDLNFDPHTIAINSQGQLYVSEQSRVQVFQPVGFQYSPLPNILPSLNSPEDLTFLCGIPGFNITWQIIDPDVDEPRYIVYRNGIVIANNTWTTGLSITYSLNSLSVGNYNYTIVVSDGLGGVVSDQVWVYVQNVVPSISSPNDITYIVNSTGNSISWTITDNSIANSYAIIYRNGTQVKSQSWTSGQTIVLNINGLEIGYYNFTIFVFDGYGASANDTVFVRVNPYVFPLSTPVLNEITPNPSHTGNITLIWSSVPGAAYYQIFRSTQNSSTLNGNAILLGNFTSASMVDINRTNGTYYYFIRAYNSSGYSDFSNIVNVTVQIYSVPSSTASNSTSSNENSNPTSNQSPFQISKIDGYPIACWLLIIAIYSIFTGRSFQKKSLMLS
jgi:sugar lactone lactonase YvrE